MTRLDTHFDALPRVRVGIVCTHPIQYHAPAFRALAARADLDVMVFYEWERPTGSIDVEFERVTDWDVPLLGGYPHQFVPNASADPGTHHFGGIDNPALVRTIESWNPDVLVVYGWAFRSHLRVLRAFHRRVPLVFRGDSTLLDERPGVRTFARRAWLRWVYHHVDLALYCGKLNKAYFEAHGLRPEQLRWGPHAVDNESFASHDEDRSASARDWRRRRGIGDDDVAFLFAGKLSPRKGPETLLSAFIALNGSDRSRAHLVFAGDGKLSEALRAKAGRHDNVHFLGFQNQSVMPVIYRLGDVTVLPSEFGETWGLAVNESFACGRPVIVSDRVGCAVDLVAGKGTGVIFEHGSVEGLRNAMTVLLADPATRMSMTGTARKEIKDWTIAAYTERLASVAVELAAQRAASAKTENDPDLNGFSKARDD